MPEPTIRDDLDTLLLMRLRLHDQAMQSTPESGHLAACLPAIDQAIKHLRRAVVMRAKATS